MVTLHVFLLLFLSYVLGRAAGFVTRSAHRLAKAFRVSDFIIGFFVVGIATSTPEITVAINSALRQAPGLSLGNLLGASIVILLFLAGLAAILAGKLSINKFLKQDDFILYLMLSALPVVAIWDGRLSRWDGLLLIGAYFLFVSRMYRRRNVYKNNFSLPAPDGVKISFGRELTMLLLALGALLVASYYLVNSALFLAGSWHISPLILGLLILSISTNMPELALVLTQSKRKSQNIIVGDLMSNVLLNTPTLGMLAVIYPFTIPHPINAYVSGVFLLVAVILFGALMWSKNMLTRREGLVLFVVYLAYAISNTALAGS